jgi:tRNA nucleotidyltransferase (CCA-adding enzyme)
MQQRNGFSVTVKYLNTPSPFFFTPIAKQKREEKMKERRKNEVEKVKRKLHMTTHAALFPPFIRPFFLPRLSLK